MARETPLEEDDLVFPEELALFAGAIVTKDEEWIGETVNCVLHLLKKITDTRLRVPTLALLALAWLCKALYSFSPPMASHSC